MSVSHIGEIMLFERIWMLAEDLGERLTRRAFGMVQGNLASAAKLCGLTSDVQRGRAEATPADVCSRNRRRSRVSGSLY